MGVYCRPPAGEEEREREEVLGPLEFLDWDLGVLTLRVSAGNDDDGGWGVLGPLPQLCQVRDLGGQVWRGSFPLVKLP